MPKTGRKEFSLAAWALNFLFLPLLAADPVPAPTPLTSYSEIPYYLRQLRDTDLESKRMEYNKIVHDAVVNADLSDKKVVKNMEPIVDKIRIAMDSGLDRPYLEGQSMWLASAVDYFEREKLRKTISIPENEWMTGQMSTLEGRQISPYPQKILLIENEKSKVIAESSDIHEAVISPDGRTVAFFRQKDESSKAEIWIVNLKNLKRKKIAVLPSCTTILFSIDGDHLFVQEKPLKPKQEATVYRLSAGGGKLKPLGKATALQTIVGKGEHRGALIVFRAKQHHLATSMQECTYAWDESGKELGKIKEAACR